MKGRQRATRSIAALASVVALAAAAVVPPALAKSSPHPKTGNYSGHSSTNVPGNQPLQFSMGIAHAKCRPPGGGKKHRGYCVTVSATSLIQAQCSSGFVKDAFFPATEPIKLSSKRKISHLYTLYESGGQEYDTHVKGGTKIGTFQFDLHVGTDGTAGGSMRYVTNSGGTTCDSGVVSITAKHKK